MSSKFYICPIIGSGTDEDMYRPKIADYTGVNWTGVIPSKPDGSPVHYWALVYASSGNLSVVDADMEIRELIDLGESGRVSFLKAVPVLNKDDGKENFAPAKKDYLGSLGIDLTGAITVYDIVKRVKDYLDPRGNLDDVRVG